MLSFGAVSWAVAPPSLAACLCEGGSGGKQEGGEKVLKLHDCRKKI